MIPVFLRRLVHRLTYRPLILVNRGNLYHHTVAHIDVPQRQETGARAALFADASTSGPDESEDITCLPTAVEMPVVSDAFLLDRKLAGDDLTTTQARFLAVRGIELASPPRETPVQRAQPRETALLPLRIVSYSDKRGRLSLDALIGRAVRKCVRSNGALPTHVVVNALRLMGERPQSEWYVYLHATSSTPVAIEIVTNARCPWHTARAYIDASARRAQQQGGRRRVS